MANFTKKAIRDSFVKLPSVSEFQAQRVSLSIGKEESSRYNEGTNQEHL